MKYSIKYAATLIFTVILAINCDVANSDKDENETIEKELIIYTSNKNGPVDIYIAENDGSDQIRITKDDFIESSPVISPNGKTIAFIRENNVWIMDLDGTKAKPIYSEGESTSVSWSLDGKKLIVSLTNGIVLVKPDGMVAETHIVTKEAVRDLNAKMHPDGNLILYTAPIRQSNEVFKLNWETKESTQLTNNDVDDEDATWSPNGSEILYVSKNAVGAANLFTMTANGELPTQITNFEAGTIDDEVNPCWSNENEIYLTTIKKTRRKNKQKAAQDHNASRSNTTSGIMSDIITDGDVKGVGCSQKVSVKL